MTDDRVRLAGALLELLAQILHGLLEFAERHRSAWVPFGPPRPLERKTSSPSASDRRRESLATWRRRRSLWARTLARVVAVIGDGAGDG